MKASRIFPILMTLFALTAVGRANAAPTCSVPIVFFDFGDTIVSSTYLQAFDVFINTRYTPGTFEYLNDLKTKGYTLAMMVNYPESYGGGLSTIELRDQRKLEYIKRETTEPLAQEVVRNPAFQRYCKDTFGVDAARLCQTWTDRSHVMDWSVFELPEYADIPGIEAGGILVPDRDNQRKPSHYMFQRAMAVVRRMRQAHGSTSVPYCPVIFMGENAHEVVAATRAGMIGIQVGDKSWPTAGGQFSFLYPEALLSRLTSSSDVVAPTGPVLKSP